MNYHKVAKRISVKLTVLKLIHFIWGDAREREAERCSQLAKRHEYSYTHLARGT